MNRLSHLSPWPGQKQTGASLLAAMLFLIVLSLLAVISVRNVVMQERMSGNTQDWDLAFQAAEAALRDGETDIASHARVTQGVFTAWASGGCGTGEATGLCLPSADGTPIWSHMNTADPCWAGTAATGCTASLVYGSQTGAAKLTVRSHSGADAAALDLQPRYVIEDLGAVGGSLVVGCYGCAPPPHAYRVTAVGFGNIRNADGSPAVRVVLQSVFVS
jgi:type IV pilus assembly protein PilX